MNETRRCPQCEAELPASGDLLPQKFSISLPEGVIPKRFIGQVQDVVGFPEFSAMVAKSFRPASDLSYLRHPIAR